MASISADSRERFASLLLRAFDVYDSKTLVFGGFGITVDLRQGSERLLTVDTEVLSRALDNESEELHEFLRRPDGRPGRRGFVRELDELLDGLLRDVALRFDPAGGGRGLIDLLA